MRVMLLLFVVGCQSSGSSRDPVTNETGAGSAAASQGGAAKRKTIEVHDLNGSVSARVVPGHPCRATVENVQMLVGGEPLIAQVGETRWSGDDRGNGISILRDAEIVARIVEDKPGQLSLVDPTGIPMIRVLTEGDDVQVIDKQSAVVRHVTRSAKGVEVQPGPTVTGTEDRLLVAALTAIEAPPEVRALAACHRLFALEKM